MVTIGIAVPPQKDKTLQMRALCTADTPRLGIGIKAKRLRGDEAA